MTLFFPNGKKLEMAPNLDKSQEALLTDIIQDRLNNRSIAITMPCNIYSV